VEPLDLTEAPPRSPRVQLGGLYVLARSIDKMRAHLPGGKPGAYVTDRGLTKVMLETLGVAPDQFRDIVARARSDDDVVRWLHENTNTRLYAELNERFARWTLADNPPERWDFIDSLYPNRPAGPRETVNVFDLLENDDREMFQTRGPSVPP
jgi:hypothetical protein